MSVQPPPRPGDLPLIEPSGLEVQVTRHRWANMGDHAVLSTEAVKYDPAETVEAMVTRVLSLQQRFQRHDPMDHITLRVVEGTIPEYDPNDTTPPF